MRRQVQKIWLPLAALLWLLAGCVMPDGTVVEFKPVPPPNVTEVAATPTTMPEEEMEPEEGTDSSAAESTAGDATEDASTGALVTYTSPDGFLAFEYPEAWLFLGASAEGDLPAAAIGSSAVLLELGPGSAFPPGELTTSILLMPAELLTAMVGASESEEPMAAVALGVMLALGPADSPEIEVVEPAPFAPLTEQNAYAATVTAQSMQQTLVAFEAADGVVLIADYTMGLGDDSEPPVAQAIAAIGSGRLVGEAEDFLAYVDSLYQ